MIPEQRGHVFSAAITAGPLRRNETLEGVVSLGSISIHSMTPELAAQWIEKLKPIAEGK